MGFLNTAKDGTGTRYDQLGDREGRTVIVGPTGVTTRFRFLVGNSGTNSILPAPGTTYRYKISALYAQNLGQDAGVTGILRGNSDIAGVYFPKLTDTYAPVITFVESDLMPLVLGLDEPLNLLLSAAQNISGWGICLKENF